MTLAEPALPPPLVFVPTIGFRPGPARTLAHRGEVTAERTRLIVLAVAAGPDKTDVLVEWERSGDPVTCAPGSQLLMYSNMSPLDKGTVAALVAGATTLKANAMAQRAYHGSLQTIGMIHTITFPPLPLDVGSAELVVGDNGDEWRVALTLASAPIAATRLTAGMEREGISVRATALARHDHELVVHVEVESGRQIRQVGQPIAFGPSFAVDSESVRRARRAEMRRVFGDGAHPITLEDDRGARHEEVRRMFDLEGQQARPGQPFINRFAVVFDEPDLDAQAARLVVPFVDITDPEGAATADLRDVPMDLELGSHRFHVQSAEPVGNGRRRVIVEAKPSPWPPRFRHPARIIGAHPNEHSWPNAGPGEQIVFDAAAGDPPIVTFTGAVFRVDGPLRLEIPRV